VPIKRTAVLLTAMVSITASAQFRPQHRFALSGGHVAQAIVKALSERGYAIDSHDVSLLVSVVATVPDPVLEIRAVEPMDRVSEPSSKVKVACHLPGTCVPFYALMRWSTAPPNGMTTIPVVEPRQPIVMRAGTHATLWMGDGRSQIQMPVISLEQGATGRSIRVASSDRRRTYVAEIVSPHMLKGSF